ncbi:hypothetical protein VTK26DRAFT_1964 [Humicola hyalothermophila]
MPNAARTYAMEHVPDTGRGSRRTRAAGRVAQRTSAARQGTRSVFTSEPPRSPPSAHPTSAFTQSTPTYDDSSDDEVGLPVEDAFERGDMSDAEQVAGFGEPDDELLGDAMTGDLVEMISEQDEDVDSEDQLHGAFFDPTAMGLKEINNLAHFGVSSHKPGNGVAELLSDDLDKYWQSDGQQPHMITIHFLRRVEIRAIRFYVDYNQDESYTPTHIVFYAGTGHHDLVQFAEVLLTNPVGWQDVPIAGCGGGADGNSLCCWIVQMHVKENHQNGKDTHIRGLKVYALDEQSLGGTSADRLADDLIPGNRRLRNQTGGLDQDEFQELLDSLDRFPAYRSRPGEGGFSDVPDFMRDPVIR